MQLLTAKKPKPQASQFINSNQIEAIRSIGSGAIQSLATDFVKEGINDVWEQFLGSGAEKNNKHKTSGDLQEGQDLELAELKKDKKHENKETGIDYRREVLHGSERIVSQESYSLNQQIESIIIELKRLVTTSQELQIQFKDVIMEQRIVKPGKYHKNFFEWILIVIRSARMRAEDAGAWLQVMKGKKNKKQSQNYWQMFKKHGTTFGLSNERVLASQTG